MSSTAIVLPECSEKETAADEMAPAPVHPLLVLPPEMLQIVLSHASRQGCRLKHLMLTCKIFHELLSKCSDGRNRVPRARLRQIVFKKRLITYQKLRSRHHRGWRKYEKPVSADCCKSDGVELSQLLRYMKLSGRIVFDDDVVSDKLLLQLTDSKVAFDAGNVDIKLGSVDAPNLSAAQLQLFFNKVQPNEIHISGQGWNSFLTDDLLRASASKGIESILIQANPQAVSVLPGNNLQAGVASARVHAPPIFSDTLLDQLASQKTLPTFISMHMTRCGFTEVGMAKLLNAWINEDPSPMSRKNKTYLITWDFGYIKTTEIRLRAAMANIPINPALSVFLAHSATIVAFSALDMKKKLEVSVKF